MSLPFAGLRAVVGAMLAVSIVVGPALAQVPTPAPLTLTEALRRAEASSPQIEAAEAEVRAAEGRARQAGLGPNPSLSLEVENALGSGPYSGMDNAETTLAVEQTLELGGKRRARVAAARAEVEAARARLAIARADIAFEVRSAFAEVLAARKRLALAEQAVERATELARIATKLVEEGREPPLRAYRALTAASEAAVARDAARAQLASSIRALTLLTGEPEGAFELIEPVLGESPSYAQLDPSNTLDVQLAELELGAARARIDVERTARVPDVTVGGGVRQFRDSDDTAFVAGVSVPLPIGNRNQGSIAAAEADATAAQSRRNLALAQANRRIADARAALAAADARLATLRKLSIPDAEEAVRLARLGYQEGEFSLLEVLDAEQALATARDSLIEAELSRAKALAALERAAAH